jgi:hypothetical protein
MKTTFAAATFVTATLAIAGLATAQTYATPSSAAVSLAYGGYGSDYYGSGYHTSTYEEGALRGWGALAEAYGHANYFNSLAAVNGQEAYNRYLQNREKRTETYFRMKQIYRAAREAAAPQRLTREQYVALAKKEAPDGLSERQYDRVLGRLNWPAALTDDLFAAERDALDHAFLARSPSDSGAGSRFYTTVRQLTSSLEAKLKDKVDQLDAGEYLAAKKFILGLAYESQQPLVLRSLAAR